MNNNFYLSRAGRCRTPGRLRCALTISPNKNGYNSAMANKRSHTLPMHPIYTELNIHETYDHFGPKYAVLLLKLRGIMYRFR